MVVVIEGKFTSGSQVPAIRSTGSMLLRDLHVEGYHVAVENVAGDSKSSVPASEVKEWISGDHLGEGPSEQMKLPIKQSPEFVSENPDDWQDATEFFEEDKSDQTAAIQRALNSGKPIVYFPNGSYSISKTLAVPPAVRRITGFQSAISANKEKFRGTTSLSIKGSGKPLVIEHFWFSRGAKKEAPSDTFKRVQLDSARSVVFRHVDMNGGYENTRRGRGDVFFEDTIGVPIRIEHPQSI